MAGWLCSRSWRLVVLDSVRTFRYGRSVMFDYRLAVLTHGRMTTLDTALASFYENVTPAPSQVCVYADGVIPSRRRDWLAQRGSRVGAELRAGPAQQGFCAATGQLWQWASAPDVPYVFWLEHDFVFLRPVDVRELAVVLDADHLLAQVALVRGPVSPEERAAGGLIESRPGEFEEMCGVYDGGFVQPTDPWLRHRSFFTTNPSLMRREFMASNPWPTDGEPLCEGHYGIDLVQRGYKFAYWGGGEQWVDHVGRRTGFGY